MTTKREVVGWVLVDAEHPQVLILEDSGRIMEQRTSPETALGPYAIQTGAFRRGQCVIDPVTDELLGFDIGLLSSPFAGLS